MNFRWRFPFAYHFTKKNSRHESRGTRGFLDGHYSNQPLSRYNFFRFGGLNLYSFSSILHYPSNLNLKKKKEILNFRPTFSFPKKKKKLRIINKAHFPFPSIKKKKKNYLRHVSFKYPIPSRCATISEEKGKFSREIREIGLPRYATYTM